MRTSRVNKINCQRAYDLRSQGHTYSKIGQALGISEQYARLLVQVNEVIQQRDPVWTYVLSSRVSNAIRHAGFTSRAEVIEAFSNEPDRIKNCMGLGNVGIAELLSWAGVAD